MEWQPIESAPKDGTRVLLIDASEKNTKACTGEWNSLEWRDAADIGCNGQYEYEPTHWMPLPPPPGE